MTCTYYRTRQAQWEAITGHAFFSWQNGQAHGLADLPDRYPAPYPGWTA